MLPRQLQKSNETTLLTVPISFVRDIGLDNWFERKETTDYQVWVTWLQEREAFSYYFPDPTVDTQPKAAIPRQLHAKVTPDIEVYQVSIPHGALRSQGITEEVINDGYTVFPELEVEDRLLTVALPRPDDRPDPWSGLGDVAPESPTADWVVDGTTPDGAEPESVPPAPRQRGGQQ
jgi:hypothetical protein